MAAGLDCPALAIALLVMSFGTLCEVPVKSGAAAGHESKQFKVVLGTYVVGRVYGKCYGTRLGPML